MDRFEEFCQGSSLDGGPQAQRIFYMGNPELYKPYKNHVGIYGSTKSHVNPKVEAPIFIPWDSYTRPNVP